MLAYAGKALFPGTTATGVHRMRNTRLSLLSQLVDNCGDNSWPVGKPGLDSGLDWGSYYNYRLYPSFFCWFCFISVIFLLGGELRLVALFDSRPSRFPSKVKKIAGVDVTY